jgi:hypothetical protein
MCQSLRTRRGSVADAVPCIECMGQRRGKFAYAIPMLCLIIDGWVLRVWQYLGAGKSMSTGKAVTHAVVQAMRDYSHTLNPDSLWYGGGPVGTLRAYQAFHPNAAIYTVTYRGRTVWMTSKQQHIWHEVQAYWRRGKRDTLARIAKVVGCSRATVSRFLRRLDLWRFLDLVTLRGRNGGTYIFTRRDPYNETPQRWTMATRQRIRNLYATYIRHRLLMQVEILLQPYKLPRVPKPPYWQTAVQTSYLTGSTDATFKRPTRISGGAIYGKYPSRKGNRK